MIKLADRLHNMRTLGPLRPVKRRRIAQETLEIYIPIANRLGIYTIRHELENLVFKAIHPIRYDVLEHAVDKAGGHRKELIDKINQALGSRLVEMSIDSNIVSLWRIILACDPRVILPSVTYMPATLFPRAEKMARTSPCPAITST